MKNPEKTYDELRVKVTVNEYIKEFKEHNKTKVRMCPESIIKLAVADKVLTYHDKIMIYYESIRKSLKIRNIRVL